MAGAVPARLQLRQATGLQLAAAFVVGVLAANTYSSYSQRAAPQEPPPCQPPPAWRKGGPPPLPAPLPTPDSHPKKKPSPSWQAFSMSSSVPDQEMFEKLQKKPSLAKSDNSYVEEFTPAPWLLPLRTKALPYAGEHRLDKLMALRSMPAGDHKKSVVFLLFSREWAMMAQNSVYSLVKHGGTTNYIAVTWQKEDLEACLDLNLPCADVADLLPERLGKKKSSPRNLLVLGWLKPVLVLHALKKGYAVMVADADVAYSVKPLWGSYLEFLKQTGSDGAWAEDKPSPSTAQFVLLPTPASLAFAKAWSGLAAEALSDQQSDQQGLALLEGEHFVRCDNPCRCYRAVYELEQQGRREEVAVFRTYLPAHQGYSPNGCTLGSPNWVPRIDPCDWGVLYVHPMCEPSLEGKERLLRATGFWFMDNEEGCAPQAGAASKVPACQPLQWRLDKLEDAHYACGVFHYGLAHGGEPAAVTTIRKKGLEAVSPAELFDEDKERMC